MELYDVLRIIEKAKADEEEKCRKFCLVNSGNTNAERVAYSVTWTGALDYTYRLIANEWR